LRLAVGHAERVVGLVAISPGVALAPDYVYAADGARRWADTLDSPTGWEMRNRQFWRRDGGYRAWVEFFFDQLLPEPHSTKPYEDAVSWALDTDAEAMIAEREGRAAPGPAEAEALCRSLQCPVLVIHGTDDHCQPLARGLRMAELTAGELLVIEGAGHLPHARDPVKVNLEIERFLRRVA
jgi:pimeloyl-ACP methyl ester carboxylesterase